MFYKFLYSVWIISELSTNSVICQSETTISTKEETLGNLSVVKQSGNGTISMSRITQPSEIPQPLENFQLNSTRTNLKQFIPSPPVEEYERNKVYVKPAIPEAKAFNGENTWEKTQEMNSWRGERTSWNNRVKFPSNAEDSYRSSSAATDVRNHNHAYPTEYYKQKNIADTRDFKPPTNSYLPNRPANIQKTVPVDSYGPPVRSDFVEKPLYYEEEIIYPPNYGSSYEISPPHKNPGYGGYAEENAGNYGGISTGYLKSPWKKIIKFLATIIPIGLLISALTPNVINIQNNTDPVYKAKYRNEDESQEFTKRLSSSIRYFTKLNEDGCEDRVLCELLVSAAFSKNAEEYVKTLLDNFLKQEDIKNKKEDLMKIFDAVKQENCKPIQCGKKEVSV